MKTCSTAIVDGEVITVVDPKHFYAVDAGPRGRGLFCNVDLDAGDCWWALNYADPRYVARLISWSEYESLSEIERLDAERLCYFDLTDHQLVICNEPFCRVNHSMNQCNSESNTLGNSVVFKPVPAGTEITIPYTYEAVNSLIWKFPTFKAMLTSEQISNPDFIFRSVTECDIAMQFLTNLG